MAAPTSRLHLVAVDANVLFHLAAGLDDVVDSVRIIRQRLREVRLILPPTVQPQLGKLAFHGTGRKSESARKAIGLSQAWRIVPVNLLPVRHGIAERIAHRIRERHLIPDQEVNDSLIVAESALLGCSILLTSDEHLRGIDFERLTLELQTFDLVAPVIATHREIVVKFSLQ